MAELEPRVEHRVNVRDGFAISLWTYYEPGEHYPGADHDLIRQCRILMWALFTTWRWRHDDQLPDGHHWSMEGLNQVRAALDRYVLGWA